jgi:hypothetical protein
MAFPAARRGRTPRALLNYRAEQVCNCVVPDTLDPASACGVSLRPRRSDEPRLGDLLESWMAVTYLLNNVNRGMGLPDGYPFVLPTPAVDKLRFVHEVVGLQCPRPAAPRGSGGSDDTLSP